MNADLHNYMTVGIVHFIAFPETMRGEGPIVETLARIAEDPYFGAVEVTTMRDEGVRAEAARLLKTSKLVVGYGAQAVQLSHKLDLNSLDERRRQEAIERLKACIDEAAELGATRLAVLSGPDPGDANRPVAIQALVDSLKELCAYAARKGGMGITLETFDRDIDKKALVGPNALAVEISRQVRREYPNFGLMIDLSHLPLQRETPREALTIARDDLVHAHIGNCVLKDKSHPLYGDLHPRFGIEGGENDVPEVTEFLRVLLEIGYIGEGKRNIVAFEVRPHFGESSLAVIANAKRTLNEAWFRL